MPLFPVTVDRPRAGAYEAAREAGYKVRDRQIDAASQGEAEACNRFLAAYDDRAAMRRQRRAEVDRELLARLTVQINQPRLLAIGGAALKLFVQNGGHPIADWPARDRNRLLALGPRFARATALLEAAETIEAQIDAATLAELREIYVGTHSAWPS
jgi:hypothetical protein